MGVRGWPAHNSDSLEIEDGPPNYIRILTGQWRIQGGLGRLPPPPRILKKKYEKGGKWGGKGGGGIIS